MNENENNFDALCQLLELKRHEMPPPGYFDRFSGQVIARIRAGQARKSETSALAKFLQLLEFKPAFAGALASAILLLLVFGVVYSDRPDSTPQPFFQNIEPMSGSLAAITPTMMPPSADSIGIVSSNNADSLQPVASLFGQQNPFAQQVSFTVPGN